MLEIFKEEKEENNKLSDLLDFEAISLSSLLNHCPETRLAFFHDEAERQQENIDSPDVDSDLSLEGANT